MGEWDSRGREPAEGFTVWGYAVPANSGRVRQYSQSSMAPRPVEFPK
jgi:hypothetical protein